MPWEMPPELRWPREPRPQVVSGGSGGLAPWFWGFKDCTNCGIFSIVFVENIYVSALVWLRTYQGANHPITKIQKLQNMWVYQHNSVGTKCGCFFLSIVTANKYCFQRKFVVTQCSCFTQFDELIQWNPSAPLLWICYSMLIITTLFSAYHHTFDIEIQLENKIE